jgi:hypothetical protein
MNLDNRSTKGQAGNAARRIDDNSAIKPGGKDIKSVKQSKPAAKPGWATGLRQLYDAVVDEPLPDSFNDLIAKLDSKS